MYEDVLSENDAVTVSEVIGVIVVPSPTLHESEVGSHGPEYDWLQRDGDDGFGSVHTWT